MNSPPRPDDIELERYELFEALEHLETDPPRVLPHRRRRADRRACCSAMKSLAQRPRRQGGGGPPEIGAWLHIGEDSADHRLHRQGRGRPEHPHVARAGRRRGAARAGRSRSSMVMADTALVPVRRRHLRQPHHAGDGAASSAAPPPPPARCCSTSPPSRRRSTAARSTVADGKVSGPGRQAVVHLRRADEGPEADEGDRPRRRRPPAGQVDGRWARRRRRSTAGRSSPARTSTPRTSAGRGCCSARCCGRRRSRRSSTSVGHEGGRGDRRA